MKYLFFILVVLLNCKTPNNEMKNINNNESIALEYEGSIDKPLPVIIFCQNCEDSAEFRIYKFRMNQDFFININPILLSFKNTIIPDDAVAISVIINKKQKMLLNKDDAKSFIEKLTNRSRLYNKNIILQTQLDRYKKILH